MADKQEGPSPILTFLGIVIDTPQGEFRLPPEKLQCLLNMLQAWQSKRACTRQDLESLTGSLQHALVELSCIGQSLSSLLPSSLTIIYASTTSSKQTCSGGRLLLLILEWPAGYYHNHRCIWFMELWRLAMHKVVPNAVE